MRSMFSGRAQSALALAGGLALALILPAWLKADPDRLLALTRPAAGLAGYILGLPVDPGGPHDPVLLHPDFPLRVIPACAGADFLGLLAGLLLWRTLRARPGLGLWIAPVALALTLLANGARLAALLLIEGLVASLLPVYLHNALHAVTGVAVFLPVLLFAYLAWERIVMYER